MKKAKSVKVENKKVMNVFNKADQLKTGRNLEVH